MDKNYLNIDGIIYTKEEFLKIPRENGVPKVVWAFWGGGELNENRLRGITMMRDNLEVPVCLITPEHLQEFVLDEYPLHEGYQYLRALHQSDYMRIYLWHHYGGGWHDVKPTGVSYATAWSPFADCNVHLVGRPEVVGGTAGVYDEKGNWMPDYMELMVSCGWWIGRQRTAFSLDTYQRLHNILDSKLKKLRKCPARYPYDTYKTRYPFDPNKKPHLTRFERRILRVYNYPMNWAEVFGDIFHPMVYKYNEHVVQSLPYDEEMNLGYGYR